MAREGSGGDEVEGWCRLVAVTTRIVHGTKRDLR